MREKHSPLLVDINENKFRNRTRRKHIRVRELLFKTFAGIESSVFGNGRLDFDTVLRSQILRTNLIRKCLKHDKSNKYVNGGMVKNNLLNVYVVSMSPPHL